MSEEMLSLVTSLLPKLPKDLDFPELEELRTMLLPHLELLELEIEELLQIQDVPYTAGMVFIGADQRQYMFVTENEDATTFLDLQENTLVSYDEGSVPPLRFTLQHPLNVGWLLVQLKNLRVATNRTCVTVGQGVGCVGDTLAEAAAKAWIQEREDD